MFNMNDLWEKFVLSSIKRNKDEDMKVQGQLSKSFGKVISGGKSRMKPDIVITKDDETIVLDTNGKILMEKIHRQMTLDKCLFIQVF